MILRVLKKVEWSFEWCGHFYCPVCKKNKIDGHKDDCELKHCIDDAERSHITTDL